jgi:hypothetical protein
MTPASFSHPLLAAQKVVPQPAAEPQADVPPAPKSDKASEADTPVKPAISAASLELRSTVGHANDARPAIGEVTAPASLRERTRTADASSDMPSTQPSATMTDAAPSGGNGSMREDSKTTTVAPLADDAAAAKVADPVQPDAKPETASSDVKPTETIAADAASTKTDEHAVVAPSSDDAAKAEISATGSTKAEENTAEKKTEAKVDESKAEEAKAEEAKAEAAKPDAAKSSDKPDDAAKEMTKATTDATPVVPDATKDQARLPDPVKPAAAKPDQAVAAAPKRAGQIAVFISRKDSKLYVRQNFAPLFDAPVTVAPSDRPLGTHVFTAEIDKNNANVVHWSVVTLPAPRHAERRDEDERASRRRKIAGAVVEARPSPEPDSPAEALDRLSIPADVMARITDALTTGASIIVSDQGINGGETGEGTDFIVSLR